MTYKERVKWTQEKMDLLILGIAEGKNSGELPEILGMTKGQIMGRIRRYKLKLNGPGNYWTHLKNEQLTRLAEEDKTVGEAMVIMELPRNSIARQAKKLELKFRYVLRSELPAPIAGGGDNVKGPQTKPRMEPMNHPSFSTPVETQKRLIDLNPRDCRWSVGDDWWCGAESIAGKSLCEEHYAIGKKKMLYKEFIPGRLDRSILDAQST